MKFRKIERNLDGVSSCSYFDYIVRKLGHVAKCKGSNGPADIRPDRWTIKIDDLEDLKILQGLYCIEAGSAWEPAGIVPKYKVLQKAVKRFLQKESSFDELKRLFEELEATDPK
jgi:hypothetical protein